MRISSPKREVRQGPRTRRSEPALVSFSRHLGIHHTPRNTITLFQHTPTHRLQPLSFLRSVRRGSSPLPFYLIRFLSLSLSKPRGAISSLLRSGLHLSPTAKRAAERQSAVDQQTRRVSLLFSSLPSFFPACFFFSPHRFVLTLSCPTPTPVRSAIFY